MQLTHENKTLSVKEWATICGIAESTIYSRLSKGWTPKEALTTPIVNNDNKITKNDAEMWLNDLAFDSLPKCFKDEIARPPKNLKKYGQFIRSNHRTLFDLWFKLEYCKQLVK